MMRGRTSESILMVSERCGLKISPLKSSLMRWKRSLSQSKRWMWVRAVYAKGGGE